MTMITETRAKPNRKLVLSRETVRVIGGSSERALSTGNTHTCVGCVSGGEEPGPTTTNTCNGCHSQDPGPTTTNTCNGCHSSHETPTEHCPSHHEHHSHHHSHGEGSRHGAA